MDLSIELLHDATLVSVSHDWSARVCELKFAGSPLHAGPFSMVFSNVTKIALSADFDWGASVSALGAEEIAEGVVNVTMQSGDTIVVHSSSYTFKPTRPSDSAQPESSARCDTNWNYRVFEEEGQFAVHEVFYKSDGSVAGWTENPVFPRGETRDELATDISRYADALSEPVLRRS